MKISVITCTYNSQATVADTVESALAQDYPDVEYIVVDGHSTDHTVDILKGYGKRIDRILSEPDMGIYDALNKGIAMATGDVVGLLHSDDVYASEEVLGMVAAAFAEAQTDAVYGDLLYVSYHNTDNIIRYWKAGSYSQYKLREGWMPPHPTLFIRREMYEQHGFFNTDFSIAADYELMMRFLGQYNMQMAYIPKILVKMRMGGASNKNLGNILRKMREDYQAMRNYGTGNWRTLLLKSLVKLSQFIRR